MGDQEESVVAGAVVGLSCCVGAGVLYLASWINSKESEYLNHLPRVNRLNELASKNLPLTVTICGRVGSDTPITCKLSGLKAVIVQEKAYQQYLRRNVVETTTTTKESTHCCGNSKEEGKEERKQCCLLIKQKRKDRNVTVSWSQDSAFMHSLNEEVPWYLDDGTGRVFVVGARGATDFQLTLGRSVFEKSEIPPERENLDYAQGYKIQGVNRYEYILQTGTCLTVVGEAIRETNGTIRIQRPCEGPFYVSGTTIDQRISNHKDWARGLKTASYGLALFGVLIFLVAAEEEQQKVTSSSHGLAT